MNREREMCGAGAPPVSIAAVSAVRRADETPSSRARRGGFSLAEILIATAILGVGLAMVMAIFPAAVEVNKDSTADVLGTILCENGLAVVRASATTPLVMNPTTGAENNVFTTSVVSLGWRDLAYPSGDGNVRGFLVLARQPDPSRNDHHLVIVAYRKSDYRNTVYPVALRSARFDPNLGTNDANATYFFVTNKFGDETRFLKVGSPVIDPATGAYATILAVSGTVAVLDRPVGGPSTAIANPLVIVECQPGTQPAEVPNKLVSTGVSPATFVMTARTALRER